MSERRLPREVNIGYVIDRRTGGTHNVLEVCGKERGVRFVMAQDSETAKERDKYLLRAHLQSDKIADLEQQLSTLRQAAQDLVDNVLGPTNDGQIYTVQADFFNALQAALKEQDK